MTLSAPSRQYALASVLPAVNGPGFIAVCACGEDFTWCPNVNRARDAAHVFAERCHLAHDRARKYLTMKRATSA